MPCYDERDHNPELARRAGYQEGFEAAQHNSPVAEFLCYLLTNCQAARTQAAGHPHLAKWWAAHQERDRKKARAAADAKHNAEIDKKIDALRKQKK